MEEPPSEQNTPKSGEYLRDPDCGNLEICAQYPFDTQTDHCNISGRVGRKRLRNTRLPCTEQSRPEGASCTTPPSAVTATFVPSGFTQGGLLLQE